MRRRLLALPWLVLFFWPFIVRADSVSEQFAAARAEFGYKNFENAARLLHGLLYPQVQLTAESDIVRARQMLGLAYFYLGDQKLSREEFTALLYLRPDHHLDPFLIPPAAVQFFESIRNEPDFQRRLEQHERKKQTDQAKKPEVVAPPPVTKVRKIYLERTREQHWRSLAFLPFGIGQFQNGDRNKGILLAITGSLALGTNVFSGSMRWFLRQEDGTYPADQIDLIEGYRIVQYTALGVFAALWLYGVIDAHVHFQDEDESPWQQSHEETIQEQATPNPTTGIPLGFHF